jgi:hypothetical protein
VKVCLDRLFFVAALAVVTVLAMMNGDMFGDPFSISARCGFVGVIALVAVLYAANWSRRKPQP